MRIKPLLLMGSIAIGLTSNAAFAEDKDTVKNPYKKSFKVDLPKNTHAIYVGAGLSNGLMHVLAEKPTRIGNFYARIGQFYHGDGVAGLAGYRYPYKMTGLQNNGVYVGAFAGHVKSDRKDGKRFNRLGGGLDISYLWFDSSRIGALSIGVYVPQPIKQKDGTKLKVNPELMASISMSVGLF